jgi:hypothetical protein
MVESNPPGRRAADSARHRCDSPSSFSSKRQCSHCVFLLPSVYVGFSLSVDLVNILLCCSHSRLSLLDVDLMITLGFRYLFEVLKF